MTVVTGRCGPPTKLLTNEEDKSSKLSAVSGRVSDCAASFKSAKLSKLGSWAAMACSRGSVLASAETVVETGAEAAMPSLLRTACKPKLEVGGVEAAAACVMEGAIESAIGDAIESAIGDAIGDAIGGAEFVAVALEMTASFELILASKLKAVSLPALAAISAFESMAADDFCAATESALTA